MRMQVGQTYHVGTEARLVLPLKQLAPVNIGEEVMRLDLGGAVGTQPALRITIEQASEKVASSRGNDIAAREGQGFLEDLAVHLIGILIVEWRQAREHLVEQNAKRPPIDGLGVPIAEEQLGGKILRCSTESWLLLDIDQIEQGSKQSYCLSDLRLSYPICRDRSRTGRCDRCNQEGYSRA